MLQGRAVGETWQPLHIRPQLPVLLWFLGLREGVRAPDHLQRPYHGRTPGDFGWLLSTDAGTSSPLQIRGFGQLVRPDLWTRTGAEVKSVFICDFYIVT